MKPSKISELRAEFEKLRRRGGVKPREIEALAEALGRFRHPRGKEPTWVSAKFPELFPVSIPHHDELNRYTKNSILNQLEADLERLEEEYESAQEGDDNE